MSFPIPGDSPNPGIEPASFVSPALAGRFFTTAPPGKPVGKAGFLEVRVWKVSEDRDRGILWERRAEEPSGEGVRWKSA